MKGGLVGGCEVDKDVPQDFRWQSYGFSGGHCWVIVGAVGLVRESSQLVSAWAGRKRVKS